MADLKLSEKKSTKELIEIAEKIALNSDSRVEKLQQISELLAENVAVFDWVGFYLVDPDADRELVLGPYIGEPTEHTRIPFGTGICGQAVESHKIFVVQDVSQEDNYLSCNINVEAEIVLPVIKDGAVVAELDIDSHTKNGITEKHQEMLTKICDITSQLF